MSKKDKSNVAWIFGAYYLCSSLLSKIKAKYSHAEYYAIDASASFADLYNLLVSVSCFSSCKLIVITELPEMTDGDRKKLKEALETLDESNLIVFYMIDSADEKNLFGAVEKIGKIYQFESTVPLSSAKEWLHKRIGELNIKLDDDAMQSLLENTQTIQNGKSVLADTLENSLQRLIAYEPEKQSYSIDDVIATATFCENFIIWNLLSACDSRNYEDCINQFDKSISLHSNVIAALNETLNLMTWKYRMLLVIKDLMANGCSQQVAIEKTSAIRKVGFEGAGLGAVTKSQLVQSGANKGNPTTVWNQGVCNQSVNSFYGKKPQIEIYSRKDLFVIVECLEESLYWARTCKFDNEALLIADIVFATICNKMDNVAIKKMKASLNKMREIYE